MITEELQQQLSGLGTKYWEGKENFFIRYWIYVQRGVGVFNNFKYYIALPFATYYSFKFMTGHPLWIPAMIFGGLPILLLVGRYDLHKLAKTTEYVNAISGSIFQYKPMELNIEQVNLLKDIKDLLQKNG